MESVGVAASEVSEWEMFERAGFEHQHRGDDVGEIPMPTMIDDSFKAQLVLGDTVWEGVIVDGLINWREMA